MNDDRGEEKKEKEKERSTVDCQCEDDETCHCYGDDCGYESEEERELQEPLFRLLTPCL